jgi:hypothetical protein
MAVTMKNAVFWDVMLCGSCKNQCSFETLVLTGATWCNIPEDGILNRTTTILAIKDREIQY